MKYKKGDKIYVKYIKLKDQEEKCFHTSEYLYEDEDGDLHCYKCEEELKDKLNNYEKLGKRNI